MYLDRVTLILEVVGQKEVATVSDICAHTDLPKPSVYRLAQDLVTTGLLEPIGRGQFTIGSRLKRIAQIDHSDRSLLDTIAPALKLATKKYNSTFFLSRLRGKSVEIIHVETPDTGVSYLHPGLGKRPLHACSCSKAVAAFSKDLYLSCIMEGQLRAYTEFTLTNIQDLKSEFKTIRERGFAECVEEIERGICSVAAPIATSGPGATISIGATGSVRVFTSAFRDKLGPQIAKIARDLSINLGWDVTPDKENSTSKA